MTDPDFIIGGAPKCATTAIFDYLSQHPEIFATDPKEPHFFASSPLGRPVAQGNYSLDEYKALFAGKGRGQVSGEGSTHYLHNARIVAPAIASHAPDCRLVFCLRNPVDRAYSHYLFRQSTAGPWTTGGAGQRMDFLTFAADPEILWMGDYAENLGIFLQHFDQSQILLVFFEDIVSDPSACLSRICSHIGVEANYRFDLSSRSNETVYARFPALTSFIDRGVNVAYPKLPVRGRKIMLRTRRRLLFSRTAPKQKLADEDRITVTRHYRPSVEKLREMTGRDLGQWM
ncbi:sulfotransferase family protein [Croceicoccus marinus]|jgi:hypothetical protein|uniref:Sulfotransferase n=1 Tax=Croceicoccus marinus TaxID=450378 RepID=A0A7G6VSZ5_9SPHN|nr:sulfotransferase [Croceicoccus marinus]QNE04860.1 sulfotransferase [Croceicoccus marinus]